VLDADSCNTKFSTDLARKVQSRFRERQAEARLADPCNRRDRINLQETSPVSRAVVDLLARAAESAPAVNSIERIDVPNFGQHLIIRAFQDKRARGGLLLCRAHRHVHPRGSPRPSVLAPGEQSHLWPRHLRHESQLRACSCTTACVRRLLALRRKAALRWPSCVMKKWVALRLAVASGDRSER